MKTEAVPHKYATELEVAVVYVNQSGTVKLPITHPRFYPSPDWSHSEYEFVGNSSVHDETGRRLINNVDSKAEFSTVSAVELNPPKKRSEISRVDLPPDYLDKNYYFVKPPFMFRLYQRLCFNGFEKKYERMCRRYGGA